MSLTSIASSLSRPISAPATVTVGTSELYYQNNWVTSGIYSGIIYAT